MSSPLNLDEIRMQIEELARRIYAPKDLLPIFGVSRDDGHPYIELDSYSYDYWIRDRDIIVTHRTTLSLDELFYWIFKDITHRMASSYEAAHRNPKVDPRRMLFRYQLGLLETLNSNWRDRRQLEIDETLLQHPFVDHE